jgi:hypothetical protein
LRKEITKYQKAKELLNSTWAVDEEYLTPSIIKVMREVEEEVLSKLDTKDRIKIEEEKLLVGKTSMEEVFKI